MEFVILGLAALAVPVLGVWGFVRTVGLLRRADALEARLKVIEAQLGMAAPPLAAEGGAFRPGPASAGQSVAPPVTSGAAQPEAASAPVGPEQVPGDGPGPAALWSGQAPAESLSPRARTSRCVQQLMRAGRAWAKIQAPARPSCAC